MKKRRKIKLLSIIALVIAVAAMTLGFAAFSATLNISSSAIVGADSEKFKIKIYGFESVDNFNLFIEDFDNYGVVSNQYLSQTKNIGIVFDSTGAITAEDAIIDNSSLSIRNMNVSFFKPSNFFALYFCVLRNEGEYTAYLDYEKFIEMYYNGVLDCEILSDNYSDETATAIEHLNFDFFIYDITGSERLLNNFYLVPNEGVILAIMWKYNGPYVDAPISCSINNVQFTFSSVPNNQ